MSVALVVSSMVAAGACASHAAGPEVRCEMTYSGSSGLGPWSGKIREMQVRLSPAAPGQWNVLLEIPVKSLDYGEKVRDTKMHEMFESRRWPTIRAELREVDPALVEKTSRLAVDLTIRDQTKRIEAVVSNWKSSGSRTEFDADAVVSLEAFSLEAPSVLGLSHVEDEIKIHARVLVTSSK